MNHEELHAAAAELAAREVWDRADGNPIGVPEMIPASSVGIAGIFDGRLSFAAHADEVQELEEA